MGLSTHTHTQVVGATNMRVDQGLVYKKLIIQSIKYKSILHKFDQVVGFNASLAPGVHFEDYHAKSGYSILTHCTLVMHYAYHIFYL